MLCPDVVIMHNGIVACFILEGIELEQNATTLFTLDSSDHI